jgi:hypothetical protein
MAGVAGTDPGPTIDGRPAPAADVFISYGREDVAVAHRIREHLERGGYRCWMAPDDIQGPRSWAEQIVRAIESCRVMLVLVTARSSESAHVSREVDLAMEHGTPILPVRVEDVSPHGALRYLLALAQWVDAFPGPLDQHIDNLRERIAAMIGEEVDRATDAEATPHPRPSRSGELTPPTLRRRVLSHRWMAVGALVLVGVIAVLWFGVRILAGDEASGPDGYGDDALLDGLWERCAEGSIEACETLADAAPSESEYESFGRTCGWLDDGCAQLESHPFTYGDDAGFDRLWDACEVGDLGSCAQLYEIASPESEYAALGASCAWHEGGCGALVDGAMEYGEDDTLDRLYDRCDSGDRLGCHVLYQVAPIGSGYESFGASCGGVSPGGCVARVEPDGVS